MSEDDKDTSAPKPDRPEGPGGMGGDAPPDPSKSAEPSAPRAAQGDAAPEGSPTTGPSAAEAGEPALPGGEKPAPAAARPAAPRPAAPASAASGDAGTPASGELKPAPAAPAAPRRPAGPDPAEAALRAEVPSVPLDRLRSRFPAVAAVTSFFAGVPIVKVPGESLVEVCRFLKDDPEADMKYLSNLHGTHHPERPKPFEVIYNLYSITKRHWIELKVELAEGEQAPSVTGVWKTASWHEREAFDLLGIVFTGHPDLRRILLPDEWRGHPLRKDYPLEGNPGDHGFWR